MLDHDDARLMVRLYDARNNLLLELANESHPDYQDVYSSARATASLKLAPDDLMGDLIRDLDRLDFEGLAAEGAAPAGGVRGWVEVREGNRARAFILPADSASAEALESFANMKHVVAYYYQHIGGLQFIDNPQGADIFRSQR
ncbi:MAG: hypothetical protein ACYTCU_00555 [Planctomycetota bacterium]|jgi:hypothetical protein